MADTQTILGALLTISAGLLIWYILGLRQKRRMSDSEDLEIIAEWQGILKN